MKRGVRVASLFVPPAIGLFATLGAGEATGHVYVAGCALLSIWLVMFGAVVFRIERDRNPDVLTATGCGVMWTGAVAIVAATQAHWASLSVLGVLGLVTTCLAVIWTAIAARDSIWQRATVSRSILPELAVEGDSLREEIRIGNVRIPIGMRLFVIGRSTPHAAISRHVVGSAGDRAEIALACELDPARRGDHVVPPLALRLGDVLGLTCTPFVYRGETRFRVLPRPSAVDGVRALLGAGGDAATSRPERRMPTEGTFRIREYAPGDDARRIHWIRSLQTNQLVVRLPDEIPPVEPEVRVILDSYFEHAESLRSRAPTELLDAMVRVWLGVGKALAETGARVTLVTGARSGGTLPASPIGGAAAPGTAETTPIVRLTQPALARMPRETLHVGARIAWQTSLQLSALIDPTVGRQIVVSCRPQPRQHHPDIVWVVVPSSAWVAPETPTPLVPALAILQHPAGSSENRLARRQAEQQRLHELSHDHATFSQLLCWIDWRSLAGAYVARPIHNRVALEVLR